MEICSFVNCKEKAEYFCLCSFPKYLICKDHLDDHISNSPKNHPLKNIYRKPNPNTRNEILKFIQKEKEKILREKINIKTLVPRRYSGENSLLDDKIADHLSFLDNLKENLQKTEKVSEFEENIYIKLLSLTPENALKKIKKELPNLYDGEYNNELIKISHENQMRKIEEISKNQTTTFSEIQSRLKNSMHELLEEIKNFTQIPKQRQESFLSEISIMSFLGSDEKVDNIIKDSEYEEITKIENLKVKVCNIRPELDSFPYCKCCENDTLPARLEELTVRIDEIKRKFIKLEDASENKPLYKTNENVLGSFQNLKILAEDLFENLSEIQTNLENLIENSKYMPMIDQDFQNRKTRLTILNTMDCDFSQNYIENLNSAQQLSSLTCPIPYSDDLLVCVNGFSDFGRSNSGFACMINTKTNSCIKALSPFTPSKWVGGIKYKWNVYFFGGEAEPTEAWKFNNKEDRWECLAPMPEGAEHCSCAIWKNAILICGSNHKNIWKYIIEEDRYEKISILAHALYPGTKKIIFVSKQTIYLMEITGNLFISDRNNEFVWHMEKRDSLPNFYRAYKSFHNGKVFIGLVLWDSISKYDIFYYYSFEDEEQSLAPIKNVEVSDDFEESFLAYTKSNSVELEKIKY